MTDTQKRQALVVQLEPGLPAYRIVGLLHAICQHPGVAKHSSSCSSEQPSDVKPLALMRWLVRMVTPPGGIVCDPFMGSGSTGIAADREGFHFLGMEQNAEYAELARARILGDNPMFTEVSA